MGIKVYAETGKLIHIGRMGENLATTVVFDVSSQLQSLGSGGNFTLLVLQDKELTEVELELAENTTYLEWDITSDYTPKEGKGKCQIVYTNDEKISKSKIYEIVVTLGFSI